MTVTGTDHPTTPYPSTSNPAKETNRMQKRLATVAAVLAVAAALLAALPTLAAASPSAWWHLTAGAQPTNMWLPAEKQEVQQERSRLQAGA